MRVMLDALNPNGIPIPLPLGATMIAGYIDLADAWSPLEWQRFENQAIVLVSIARKTETNGGDFLDVENGLDTQTAGWEGRVAGWVKGRRAAGGSPGLYCSESIWSSVKAAMSNNGIIVQPNYWVAAYPGAGPTIPAGAVGHQYEDYQNLYDVSVMADFIEGIDVSNPIEQTIESMVADIQLRVASMHAGAYLPWPGNANAPGGDLTWFQQQAATALSPVVQQLAALEMQLTALAAAVAALPAVKATGSATVTVDLA